MYLRNSNGNYWAIDAMQLFMLCQLGLIDKRLPIRDRAPPCR